MGVYQYTLRKDTMIIGGRKIGRFDFAYKLGRDWEPGGMTDDYDRSGKRKINRTVRVLEAAAERAREANPDVDLACVLKSFRSVEAGWKIPVYKIPKNMTQFTEELDPLRIEGYIVKTDSGLEFESVLAT